MSSQLQAAFSLHQQGKLSDARNAYRRLLDAAPDNFDALQLLGVAELQSGNAALAMELIGRAIAVDPSNAATYANRARAWEQLGRWPEAIADYRRASELDPGDAVMPFRQGLAHRRLGDHAAAVACYDRALARDPAHARACFNRGNALIDLGQPQAAADSYQLAAQLDPGSVDAHFNLGTVLLGMQQAAAAIDVFDRALALKPDSVDAMINKGNALRELDRDVEAVALYDQAIGIAPGRTEAYNNKASALIKLERFTEALTCFDLAIAMVPDNAALHLGRAAVLRRLGRLDAALAAFERGLALAPDDVEARAVHSLCLLLNGDLRRGFEEYEWRWRAEDLAQSAPNYAQPAWRGEPLAGKRLLLRWEQGLGDTLQFCRYVPLLARQGAQVLLVAQRPLLPLLHSLEGCAALIAEDAPLPDFDTYCTLLSLPLACGTVLDTIPGAPRYLSADPARVARWRERLGPQTAPRIGLAWSGRPEHKNDAQRSLALRQVLDALPDGFELVVLQKDVRDADREVLAGYGNLRHFGPDLTDFAETAALCEAMDLVISVDTSIAHLAGALGKPLWLLLPMVPDWRWLMDRVDSPWYPSATLYRQRDAGDWDGVLARVRADLMRMRLDGFRMALQRPHGDE